MVHRTVLVTTTFLACADAPRFFFVSFIYFLGEGGGENLPAQYLICQRVYSKSPP